MALSESPAIEDLRLLLAIAETENVTQAAKLFGVSQPSITKRLKVFQGKHALLTSDGKIELTEKARMVLPSIRELVRHYDQIKAYVAEHRSAPNTLCIATGASASQHFLPAAITEMCKLAPELEIEVQATRGSERIAGVLDGHFDLAILSHDRLQIDLTRHSNRHYQSALVVEELARPPFCVIAARKSRDAKQLSAILAGQEVPLEALSRFQLIGLDRSSGIRRQLERAFASRAEKLQFGVSAAGWLAVKEYAKYGLGVGIVPLGILSREDTEDLVIRRLQSDFSGSYYMLHRKDVSNQYIVPMKNELATAASEHLKLTARNWDGVI